MITYAKLASNIVSSSIWSEDDKTLRLWIYFLAKKDSNGDVFGSPVAFAHQCYMTLEECLERLKKLESPDPHSASEDFEGRRIEKIEGGFKVLNHDRYTKLGSSKWREYNAEKQREYRANPPKLADGEFIESLQSNPAYSGVDVNRELGKATAWCLANRRNCTQRFFVQWLNRIDRAMTGAAKKKMDYVPDAVSDESEDGVGELLSLFKKQ